MSAVLHNPFRELRTRQGISQYELARRVSISKHAVLRLEQGCYEKPLPSVIDYFLGHFPSITRFTLVADYEAFQYQTRASNAHLLGQSLKDELTGCPVGIHPLVFLRHNHGINPTELSKRLCISQSTVVYFEQRSVHQHTVPEQLTKALHDADYLEADTDALVEAYKDYRTWLTSSKGLTLVR
jgi:transcriptional regulator with XRE-family HTH domain